MSTRLRVGCAALVAYPLVELAIAIALASIVGWWWVFVGIIVCIVVGLGLVRYALGATGASLGVALAPLRGAERTAIASGRPPTQGTPAQTLLIVPAGLLIAVPGLVTTMLGLILWLPLTRRRLAARWEAAMRRALPAQPPPGWPPSGPTSGPASGPASGEWRPDDPWA